MTDDENRVREHIDAVLPFRVLEAAEGKPLRIAGVAMTAGMSRNRNVYTAEELQVFAPKLVGAPIYLEHVAVESAMGKVTSCIFDAQTKSLLYEAEIYDSVIAEKIRQGLIQHVSVGADYEALDTANVPLGLHNAEMSLVAVPGIPETNIHVLERLAESLAKDKRLFITPKVREILEPLGSETLHCVFCGKPGEYLVSVCTACGDNAQSLVPSQGNEGEDMKEKDLETLAEKLAAKLNVKEALVLKCPKCGQGFDAAQWEANGWKCPNAECGAEVVPLEPGVLKLREDSVSAADALEGVQAELEEKKSKLAEADKTIEQLKALVPGVDLLNAPPKLMAVSECLERLGRLELPKMQERLSLGNQVQAQKVRREIHQVKQKYGVA